MGYFREYIDRKMGFPEITAERKKQLAEITRIRARELLVIAADSQKGFISSINNTDLIPIKDQLSAINGKSIDIILDTPGGSGESTEDIVRMVRNKYTDVAFIVPGRAKSAGTIMVMSGNEILMSPTSALGPIDAQLRNPDGSPYSAHAFLTAFNDIKQEAATTGNLNKAYIPLLQRISIADLQHAERAQDFSKDLVQEWLSSYKFQNWTTHSSDGRPVTPEDKRVRAEEIAKELRDHSKWKTHGKSIKMADLERMRLKITDYSKDAALCEAIERYFILLQMSFENTTIYKLYETVDSQIYKFQNQPVNQPLNQPKQGLVVDSEVKCVKCGHSTSIQCNINQVAPLKAGSIAFPPNNLFKCPSCGLDINLQGMRMQIEAMTKGKVV